MTPIGVAEMTAAIAVIVGVALSDLAWVGTIAAYGIIALMIGASWYHHRAKDTFERVSVARDDPARGRLPHGADINRAVP